MTYPESKMITFKNNMGIELNDMIRRHDKTRMTWEGKWGKRLVLVHDTTNIWETWESKRTDSMESRWGTTQHNSLFITETSVHCYCQYKIVISQWCIISLNMMKKVRTLASISCVIPFVKFNYKQISVLQTLLSMAWKSCIMPNIPKSTYTLVNLPI